MAKSKILINRNTNQEFPTTDPDSVMKRFPGTFRLKPDADVNADVKQVEQGILDNNLDELRTDISKMNDLGELNELLANEKKAKNRSGAIGSIEARIKELSPEANEEAEGDE